MIKLKELKIALNKMSEEQLEKQLKFLYPDDNSSGFVNSFYISKNNLYFTGQDEPNELLTSKQLKERGYSKKDIEFFDVEIEKGDFVILI